MKQAFVLITTEPGAEAEILEALMRISEVMEAHQVRGIYDIIAQVEADTTQELKGVVNLRIRHLDQVGAVLALRCVEDTDGGYRSGGAGGP